MPDNTSDSRREENLKRIKALRLMDDNFMTVVFKHSKASVEHVLRVILNDDQLVVRSVTTQDDIPNLWGHAVRLDVHAVDVLNKHYDVEIQRADSGASPKRARYNMSLLDTENLGKGEDCDKLPETYIIFIAEHDIYRSGRPLYHVERVVVEERMFFGDGGHIIYVNGEYEGGDPVGQLMADFRTNDPSEMNDKTLAEAAGYFKNNPKGVAHMCKIMEDLRTESLAEGRAEGRNNLMAALARLRPLLKAAGRESEFFDAATDEDAAKKLFEEFDIHE